jgi:molecular chaperone IbpA
MAEQNMLTVEGHKADKGDHQYLYQGISGRPFRRQFSLADYVQAKGASSCYRSIWYARCRKR